MQLSPGAVVGGRYLVERKIGAGSMGEVWAGEHIGVGYRVAIKTMLAEGVDNREIVERFKREALLLGRVRSDYVARILDFAQDSTYGLVLVLDLIEGEPFSVTLRRTKLSVEEAIDLGIDIVNGLVDLHETNIVHRDLKPSNIILEPHRGGKPRAIIVDFGVSRLIKKEGDFEEMTSLTSAGMALGTLEYMAPEQMLDSRNVTGASDLYAVGAMLFRAVAGAHVFGTQNEIELTRSKLMKDSPPLVTGRSDALAKGFEAIVGRALKRKVAERYQRADEMLADLVALRESAQAALAARASRPSLPGIGAAGVASSPPPLPPAPPREVSTLPAPVPPAPIEPVVTPDVAAPVSVSAGPSSVDTYPMLKPPGVSKGVLVVAVIGALVGGMVLSSLLFGGSDSGESAGGSEADAAAAPVPTPPPPPPPPPPVSTPDASVDAGRPDAAAPAKKPRSPSGGGALPGAPSRN